MDNRPPIWYGVLLAFVVAGMIAASPLGIAWLPLQAGLGVLALALGIGWVAAFVAWASRQADEHYAARQDARAVTPTLLLVRAVSQLTSEQIPLIPKGLLDSVEKVGYTDVEGKWIAHLITEWGPVPFDFIATFLANSDEETCWGIGDTANKTAERDYAQAFTAWLIHHKPNPFALPAQGPHSARWIGKSYSQVCSMFGVEHAEKEEEAG